MHLPVVALQLPLLFDWSNPDLAMKPNAVPTPRPTAPTTVAATPTGPCHERDERVAGRTGGGATGPAGGLSPAGPGMAGAGLAAPGPTAPPAFLSSSGGTSTVTEPPG